MENFVNLTEGKITSKLVKLALPVIFTSFIQMAYNLIDQMWLGRVGSEAVTATGAASFFVWFGAIFIGTSKVGVEVGVAQSLGRKNKVDATKFIINGLLIAALITVVYTSLSLFYAPECIGFFDLDNPAIVDNAISYLRIVNGFFIFGAFNVVCSGIYNGMGRSLKAFWISALGLILNIILDPLFIHGYSGFPALGVSGAAIATVISQGLVFLVFLYCLFADVIKKQMKHVSGVIEGAIIGKICRVGFPATLHQGAMCLVSIFLTRVTASFGDLEVGVQSVGIQIESLTWMTCVGFSTALGAFVGQNYGARKADRIKEGIGFTLKIALVWSLVMTFIFVGLGADIFSLFIPGDAEAISLGQKYLMILGFSQIFMAIEIICVGAFQGVGLTKCSSINTILFNGARIPLAMAIEHYFSLGVYSVWIAVSLSSVIKAVVIAIWLKYYLRSKLHIDC